MVSKILLSVGCIVAITLNYLSYRVFDYESIGPALIAGFIIGVVVRSGMDYVSEGE